MSFDELLYEASVSYFIGQCRLGGGTLGGLK